MASYRDEGAFHEDVTNRILNDICQLIKPKCLMAIGASTVIKPPESKG